MSSNNETRKKSARKTNNSQSAGMTSNTPIVMASVTQGTPQTVTVPEVDIDTRQTSETALGASSSGQVIEPLQIPEEEEEQELRSDYGSGAVDFRELTDLGSPY